MATVDVIVFGVLGVGLILGLLRGFLSQITGLVGLVGGCYLAWRYSPDFQALAVDRIFSTAHNDKIAFAVILIAVLIVTALISWILNKLFSKMNMSAYDRLAGGLFGALKAGLICAGILLAIVVLANDGGDIERAIGSSKTGPALWDALDRAAGVLPEDVRTDVREFLRKNSLPGEAAAPNK